MSAGRQEEDTGSNSSELRKPKKYDQIGRVK